MDFKVVCFLFIHLFILFVCLRPYYVIMNNFHDLS